MRAEAVDLSRFGQKAAKGEETGLSFGELEASRFTDAEKELKRTSAVGVDLIVPKCSNFFASPCGFSGPRRLNRTLRGPSGKIEIDQVGQVQSCKNAYKKGTWSTLPTYFR